MFGKKKEGLKEGDYVFSSKRDGDYKNFIFGDPENYHRPPIRRRAWDRNNESLIFPFECDPDSFFRQLFGEGRMQEYIDRSYMRP